MLARIPQACDYKARPYVLPFLCSNYGGLWNFIVGNYTCFTVFFPVLWEFTGKCLMYAQKQNENKNKTIVTSILFHVCFLLSNFDSTCVYCSQSYMGSLLVADVHYWHISIHAQPTFTDATKISKYSWNPNIDNFYREVGRMALFLTLCKVLSLVALRINVCTKIPLPY